MSAEAGRRIEDTRSAKDDFQHSLAVLKQEHALAMEVTRSEADKRLAELKAQHDTEVERLRLLSEEEQVQCRAKYAAELDTERQRLRRPRLSCRCAGEEPFGFVERAQHVASLEQATSRLEQRIRSPEADKATTRKSTEVCWCDARRLRQPKSTMPRKQAKAQIQSLDEYGARGLQRSMLWQ